MARFNWWAKTDLLPGSTAEFFVFETASLPGLTTAYVQSGVVPEAPLNIPAGAAEALLEATKLENNSVRPLTIGPKIALSSEAQRRGVMRALAEEMRFAAAFSEFREIQKVLLDLAQRTESGETGLDKAFSSAGASALQRAFSQAMQVSLQYAYQLP
ncbi:MAG TPA: hypothetical protein VFQ79_04830 [Bryobacteraceae bacterium]|nr:hypothetical protein [Bryobacteraceae bacterium]